MASTDSNPGPAGTGLAFAEEAITLIRQAPPGVLLVYYAGSMPFVLAFITWLAMITEGISADSILGEGALGLGILFLLMKTAQSRYAQRLLAFREGRPLAAWRWGEAFRLAAVQAPLQLCALIEVPLAFLSVWFFQRSYAAAQYILFISADERQGVIRLRKQLARRAKKQQLQNAILVWLLCPLPCLYVLGTYTVFDNYAQYFEGGPLYFFMTLLAMLWTLLSLLPLIICANVFASIVIVAFLAHTLLGIDSNLVARGVSSANPTVFLFVAGITYLCLDPIIKASYVLRVFYEEAHEDGADIRSNFRRLIAAAAMCLLLFTMSASAENGNDPSPVPTAQSPASSKINPVQLDNALKRELSRTRYAWRIPGKAATVGDSIVVIYFQKAAGVVHDVYERVRNWIKHLNDRFNKNDGEVYEPDAGKHDFTDVKTYLRILMTVLLLILGVVLLVFCVYLWRTRKIRAQAEALPSQAIMPDIADDATSADQLPEEGWLGMAQDFIARGEYRLAIRALFLAMLSHLDRQDLIHIARAKTNRDYAREIQLRAHVYPEVLLVFRDSALIFEEVWYGAHEPSQSRLDKLLSNQQRINTCAQH